MTEVVIIDAARTPVGRRKGWLRETHPVKLGAHAVRAVLERTGLAPELVEHVIFGCVSQVSEQAFNVARNVTLEARLPIDVPATSV
ncbi:MAG: acetyl-CoA C-acetyltransferase, partial [Chloroflexi bacterium]